MLEKIAIDAFFRCKATLLAALRTEGDLEPSLSTRCRHPHPSSNGSVLYPARMSSVVGRIRVTERAVWGAWGPMLLLGVSLLLAPPGRARAIEAFTWQAPAGCPDQEHARRNVEAWLTNSLGPVDSSSIGIEAEVRREGAGFRLTMIMRTSNGRSEESLFAERCDTLIDVIGLRAALAADPATVIGQSEIERPSEPIVLAEPAARHVGPPPEIPASAGDPTFQLRASGDVLLGLLPRAASGPGLIGVIEISGVRVELGVHYALPRDLHYESPASVGADIQMLMTSLRACLGPAWRRVQLIACLGADLGAMRGEGFGTELTRVSWQAWAAATAGPALRIPRDTRTGLWLGIEALLQLRDISFQVRNLPRLFENDRTAFRASLGLEVRL